MHKHMIAHDAFLMDTIKAHCLLRNIPVIDRTYHNTLSRQDQRLLVMCKSRHAQMIRKESDLVVVLRYNAMGIDAKVKPADKQYDKWFLNINLEHWVYNWEVTGIHKERMLFIVRFEIDGFEACFYHNGSMIVAGINATKAHRANPRFADLIERAKPSCRGACFDWTKECSSPYVSIRKESIEKYGILDWRKELERRAAGMTQPPEQGVIDFAR